MLSYITMISCLSIKLSKHLFTSLMKCIFSVSMVSTEVKQEVGSNADMTSLKGDMTTRAITMFKIADFSGLNGN